MKARVIETNEIEELQGHMNNDYFSKDGVHFKEFELDFNIEQPDYWKKLHHQASISAMQGILSNPDIKLNFEENEEACVQAVARVSIKLATDLVNKLKEESQCPEK